MKAFVYKTKKSEESNCNTLTYNKFTLLSKACNTNFIKQTCFMYITELQFTKRYNKSSLGMDRSNTVWNELVPLNFNNN